MLNAALIVGLAHDSLLERVKSAKSVNVVMLLRVTCVGCGVDVGGCTCVGGCCVWGEFTDACLSQVGMGLSLSLVPVLAALLQIVRYAGQLTLSAILHMTHYPAILCSACVRMSVLLVMIHMRTSFHTPLCVRTPILNACIPRPTSLGPLFTRPAFGDRNHLLCGHGRGHVWPRP